MKTAILLLLFGLISAGCATSAGIEEPLAAVPTALERTVEVPPPVVASATAPPATAAPVEVTLPAAPEITDPPPTQTPAPPATEPAAVGFGRTADGAFFHGSPDAPVTLIDYSDFL